MLKRHHAIQQSQNTGCSAKRFTFAPRFKKAVGSMPLHILWDVVCTCRALDPQELSGGTISHPQSTTVKKRKNKIQPAATATANQARLLVVGKVPNDRGKTTN